MNQRRKSFFYHMKQDEQTESGDAADIPEKKKSVSNKIKVDAQAAD